MSRATAEDELFVSMSLSTPENIKALVACFTFLNRVGKELLIEVENEVLVIRALNDAKTAYASVEFSNRFFNISNGVQMREGLDCFSCKVSLKQLCSVCKNLRHVEVLTIRAERIPGGAFDLVLEMRSAGTGIVCTHRFKYSDCDVLSAIFDDEGASTLKCPHKIFDQVLNNVYQSPEIAITASHSEFKVRSHHSPANEAQSGEIKKIMSTEQTLDIGGFDFYEFKGEEDGEGDEGLAPMNGAAAGTANSRAQQELVFCTKELKAILLLCDGVGLDDIQVCFRTAGLPIKFQVSGDLLTAQVILTTLVPRTPGSNGGQNAAVCEPSTTSASASASSSSSSTSSQQKQQKQQKQQQQQQQAPKSKRSGSAASKAGKKSAVKHSDDDDDDDNDDGGRGGGIKDDEYGDSMNGGKHEDLRRKQTLLHRSTDSDNDQEDEPVKTKGGGRPGRRTVLDDDDD